MNHNEKKMLQKMLNEADCDNNTELLRKTRHSDQIRICIDILKQLKVDNKQLYVNDYNNFLQLCGTKTPFLYNNYYDIFIKVVKDEINYDLMSLLLTVLKKIENGVIDQHEGSVEVGKILKEIYIDSALKNEKNIEKKNNMNEIKFVEPKQISWKEYKLKQ